MKLKIFLLVLLTFNLSVALPAQQSKIKFSTEADIKADIELTPCEDRKERRAEVKRLFLKMGAPEADVRLEKLGDVENVVLTKKGQTNETVIVGAHFDKTDTGCGAIDNWSGIVILAHLYRTIKDLTTQKTYKFVGFDQEELGLLGSQAMAKEIPKEDRARYCAMVNYDSFGFAYPQAMRNISSVPMLNLAEEVSKEMKMPYAQAAIQFASSDSEPFRLRDIPAISFHGLDNQWRSYLHSTSDRVGKVNTQSVYYGYRHAVVFLSRIENQPCDYFRGGKKDKKQ